MSQTETILFVVLVLSLAALIALFTGRLVWALGLRFGARRMQNQVPSTLVGLQAERDRLRAEYAMLSQRLGSRLEQINLRMAEQMAEVSRHRNRMEILLTESAERTAKLQAAESEAETLRSRLASIEPQLDATIAEAQSLRQDVSVRDMELAALRRVEIGSVTADPAVLASDSGIPASQNRLKQRIEQLTSLSRAIAENKEMVLAGIAPAEDTLIVEKLNEAARETADLQKELERLDAEWSKRLNEIAGVTRGDDTPGAVANVISLANRIRALKKDIAK